MSLVLRQMSVYVKTVVGAVIAVILLVFFLANRGNTTEIWAFRQYGDLSAVPTNLVVFVSLVVGVLLWWAGWWMVSLPGQWRTMRRDARQQDLPAEDNAGR